MHKNQNPTKSIPDGIYSKFSILFAFSHNFTLTECRQYKYMWLSKVNGVEFLWAKCLKYKWSLSKISPIKKKNRWKFKLNENQFLTLNQFLQNTSKLITTPQIVLYSVKNGKSCWYFYVISEAQYI